MESSMNCGGKFHNLPGNFWGCFNGMFLVLAKEQVVICHPQLQHKRSMHEKTYATELGRRGMSQHYFPLKLQ